MPAPNYDQGEQSNLCGRNHRNRGEGGSHGHGRELTQDPGGLSTGAAVWPRIPGISVTTGRERGCGTLATRDHSDDFDDFEGDGAGERLAATVPPDRGGIRLDQFLAATLGASRAEARRVLEAGVVVVSVDGRHVKLRDKGQRLRVGSELCVLDYRPREDWRIEPDSDSEAIAGVLDSGSGWLAVDKRAGAPVHPLRFGETGTVLNRVAFLHPEVHGVGEGALRSGVVHRLDVDTSGVLLVATEQAAWDRLRAGFREHRVEKIYRAIVEGNLDAEMELELGLLVARHRPAQVRVVDPSGPEKRGGVWQAVQVVRPLEALAGATLVEVRPRTGFLHQIRATLAHLGHPVLGDRVYAGEASRRRAGRHQLHAAALRFDEIDVSSPDPADFATLLEKLRIGP